MIAPEKIPILVYSDDGRDVDDIEAMTYLAGEQSTEIVAGVTTHMIPDRRALIMREVCKYLGLPNRPIGVGSIFPLGKEDELLVSYLRQHTIQGKSYEGEGLIECFPPATEVIHQTIDRYGSDLAIMALAPLTDLAQAARYDRENFCRIGGLFIQGQAIIEDGRLAPDPAAYNLKEDMEAATEIFALQDDVPLTLVSKHLAYTVPLLRSDFVQFEATGNPVGKYLKIHAEKGIESFADRDPETFERVFKLPADRLDELEDISKPYDALVGVALAHPEMLEATQVGRHTLIGMSPELPGVLPDRVGALKTHLMATIMRGLTG